MKKSKKEREKKKRTQESASTFNAHVKVQGSLVATGMCGAFLPLTLRRMACFKDSKNTVLCRCLYVWVDFSGERQGL